MVKLFYCTTDSQSSANELAASIVEQQLAACVNIIPGITSVYHWDNEIQHDQEWLLLIKTTGDMSETLKEANDKIAVPGRSSIVVDSRSDITRYRDTKSIRQ